MLLYLPVWPYNLAYQAVIFCQLDYLLRPIWVKWLKVLSLQVYCDFCAGFTVLKKSFLIALKVIRRILLSY